MDNKLLFDGLIDLVSERGNVSREEAELFLGRFFGTISESLSGNRFVEIEGLGSFGIEMSTSIGADRKERVIFVPAESLKEAVNKPFSHFETTLLHEGVELPGIALRSDEEAAAVLDGVSAAYLKQPKHDAEADEAAMISQPDPADEAVDRIAYVFAEREVAEEAVALPTAVFGEVAAQKKRAGIPAILIPILGGVAIALASLFFFVQQQKGIEFPIIPDDREVVAAPAPPETAEEDTIRLLSKVPETAILSRGKTLRILAEEKWGNRDFWVYIYLKNKDKIQNPNRLPAGMQLVIPFAEEYDIDASNPRSVAKAKLLGDEHLKRF